MAVGARAKLDAQKLRADFPILAQEINGKPLAYLDSAVTSQKPRQVLDAMTNFYETSYGNVHRGVYALAERATEGFEGAREKIARFVNAPSSRELIFTRNATEGLNLVAYAWGLTNLGPGDLVVVTELEHHSNFVPWQYIAKRTGAEFRMITLTDSGELDLDGLDAIAADGEVKVVATNLVSNALGTVNPVDRLTAWAHEQGAIMVVDAAQAAPHRAVDVQALGCDFLAFSAHKMCGPSGVGRALGPPRAARGDGAVQPRRPHDPQGAVRGDDLGRPPAQVRGRHVADRRGRRASARPSTTSPGSASRRSSGTSTSSPPTRSSACRTCPESRSTARRPSGGPGSSSFNMDGIHPHDVAQVLDWEGVAIRAGHHCCQPLMQRLGVAATNRASFYLYTLPEEIDRLADGLLRVRKVFG